MRWTQKLMREVAQEERALLGLAATDKLDPYTLANAHGIPVYPLSELTRWDLSDEALNHFFGMSSGTWSAALVPIGISRLVRGRLAQVDSRCDRGPCSVICR